MPKRKTWVGRSARPLGRPTRLGLDSKAGLGEFNPGKYPSDDLEITNIEYIEKLIANLALDAINAEMIPRRISDELRHALARSPAVGLLGPRQVGKTTLARAVSAGTPSIYLDLEDPSDRAKLSDAKGYLSGHADKLVILDEVHQIGRAHV